MVGGSDGSDRDVDIKDDDLPIGTHFTVSYNAH